ncbi:MAG TPA: MFS transporter, partial [Roseiflexaceae bacterium]|nr:MFS transporter [Roseiflexaceae bacterium]
MRWLRVRDRAAYLRLTGVLFLVFAAAGTISPLLANYMRALGADTAQLGLVFATYQAAALASQYWWGSRSDRLGRRKPLVLIGTAGLALVYLAYAGVPSYPWLFPLRVLEGLSYAAYSTGALALIGDVLEDEAQRGRLMGLYRMFGSLAFAIAALGGGLLSDRLDLRAPLLLAAGFYALALLLVSGVREGRRPETEDRGSTDSTDSEEPDRVAPGTRAVPALPSSPAADPSSLVVGRSSEARRVLLPFLGLAFAWFLGMGSVVALWPVYMRGAGHSQTVISGLWALAALGEVPCLMLAGYLAERFGRKWVIVGGVAGMACVYLAYTVSTALPWLVGVQVVRSLAYSCFETPALLYATELGLRQQRGRMAGLYHTATGLGGISGSVAGGAVAQQVGLPAMFRGVAALMLAVALAAAVAMPRLRRTA